MGKSPYTKLSVFEYCVLFHPPGKEDEERHTELIVAPKACMARDEDHAKMLAARDIPDGYVDQLDRCEVGVRPF